MRLDKMYINAKTKEIKNGTSIFKIKKIIVLIKGNIKKKTYIDKITSKNNIIFLMYLFSIFFTNIIVCFFYKINKKKRKI